MCGRYVLTQNLAEICAAFMAGTAIGGITPSYNAAPESRRPMIVGNRLGEGVWGWPVVEGVKMAPVINIRSETMGEKPMFAQSVRANRRCIIPASGFYEWDSSGQPFYVHAPDQKLIGLCGLWTRDQTQTVRFAILTRPAVPALSHIHPRMPVAATPQESLLWLRNGTLPTPPAFDVYPVGMAVNVTANDGPGLLDKAAAPQGHLFAAGQAPCR